MFWVFLGWFVVFFGWEGLVFFGREGLVLSGRFFFVDCLLKCNIGNLVVVYYSFV